MTGGGKSHLVTSTNLNTLHWSPYQQLVHLGSAGEGLSVGDIYGTGTISCSVGSSTRIILIEQLDVFRPVADRAVLA
jgi:fumarylacetoacetase